MKQWPVGGADVERATALVELGHPSVGPILDDMVLWLKGQNDVALIFRNFLAEIGEPAIPSVREALRGSNETQIDNLLRHVLPQWPKNAVLALSAELEKMLQRPSVFGLHVLALSLIVKNGIATHAPASEWADLFRRRALEQLEQLDRLGNSL
ncbi:MAG: hypothetical protein KF834_09995 [Burkholderiales bacterium]|nr:hypothetical protein [Burkholderiales bacterium]